MGAFCVLNGRPAYLANIDHHSAAQVGPRVASQVVDRDGRNACTALGSLIAIRWLEYVAL